MDKKLYNFIIAIIFILAIMIRIFSWPDLINDVNCDEAMLAINAKVIAGTGRDLYGTSLPVYFEGWLVGGQSSLPIYTVAFFIKLLGFSLVSIRLPMLILTLSSLFFMYVLVNNIFKNKEIVIVVLMLLAINPWDIVQSQWFLDCNFFPHIFLIAVFLLHKGIKNTKFLYISIPIFALTLYTYGVAIYFVPIFLFITATWLIKKHLIGIKELFICMFLFILFVFPIILMLIINLFNLPTITIANLTIQNFNYTVRTNDMLIFSSTPIKTLGENIICLLNVLILQNDGLIWNSFPTFGTIYLISLPIAIFGVFSIILSYKKEENNQEYQFGIILLISWLIVSIIIGILINKININRINIIWYVLIIFTGIGINKIINLTKLKKTWMIIIMIIYIGNFTGFMWYYYNIGSNLITKSYTWSRGLVSAIRFIENNSNVESVVILSEDVARNDVFIRYASGVKQKETIVSKKEFLNYYTKTKEINMNFSTDKTEYEVQRITDKMLLTRDTYVITKNEESKISNLNDYNIYEFNDYTIVFKK